MVAYIFMDDLSKVFWVLVLGGLQLLEELKESSLWKSCEVFVGR